MTFGAPQFFWLLVVVVPLLVVFLIWAWRQKQRLISQFVQSRLLANLTVGVSQVRQKIRLGLIVAAVVFLFLALVRPQWGFSWEEAKQQGLDIVVAIDTSRSMLAEDVAPNRLTRAKLAALDLMQSSKSDRLGLVSFAGTAFLQSPLTLDDEAFRQNVNALDVGIIPEGGTALAAAIETAQEAFEKGNDNHKVLVLFTDGEDHESDTEAVAAAEKAAKDGMIIFTIGVGTPEGQILRIKDEQGNTTFLKDDENNAVKSRLNETLLQRIATAANGFYLPLKGANPMKTLYDRGLAPLPKTDATNKFTRVYRERYHWPLLLAILCLVFEIFLPERKRPIFTKPSGANSDLQKAVILICGLLIPLTASASPSGALRQYNAGKFDEAFGEYQRLAGSKTNDYRLFYNAGTAAYQAKQYEEAEKYLKSALESPEIASDLKAQENTYYNLGNTQVKLGPDKWEQALTNYTHALSLDPKDTNASMNLAYVQKQLEELKKQQQQQQQQDNKQNKDQKDQKDQKEQDGQKDQKNQKGQKDQQSSDKQQDKKSDQQNQQNQQDSKQQKNDQKSQSEKDKEKQQQAQAQKDKQNKEKQEKENAASQGDKSNEKGDEQAAVAAGKMTQQEAKRILDAAQEDEKALIFSPENQPRKQHDRKIKDW